MFERFSDRARKIFAIAHQEARRYNHEYIGTEHIAIGMIREGGGIALMALRNLGVEPAKIETEIRNQLKFGPDMITMGKLPQTPRLKKVVEYAVEAAKEMGHQYVGTEHILIGLLGERDGTGGAALLAAGLTVEKVKVEVARLLSEGVKATSPWGDWLRSIPADRITGVILHVDAHEANGVTIPAGEMVVRPPKQLGLSYTSIQAVISGRTHKTVATANTCA